MAACVAWRAGTNNRVIVSARQRPYLKIAQESIPGLHKRLQIRTLFPTLLCSLQCARERRCARVHVLPPTVRRLRRDARACGSARRSLQLPRLRRATSGFCRASCSPGRACAPGSGPETAPGLRRRGGGHETGLPQLS